MALTSTEEALVRQLLDQQAAILSLAGNESTITSKLGATKVTLSDLLAASAVGDTDLFLTRQGATDKSVTGAVLRSTLNTFLQNGEDAVFRSMNEKAKDLISVRDFGAVGDGISNDTAAFVAARTLSANGKYLIPPGLYLVDEAPDIWSDTFIAPHSATSLKIGGVTYDISGSFGSGWRNLSNSQRYLTWQHARTGKTIAIWSDGEMSGDSNRFFLPFDVRRDSHVFLAQPESNGGACDFLWRRSQANADPGGNRFAFNYEESLDRYSLTYATSASGNPSFDQAYRVVAGLSPAFEFPALPLMMNHGWKVQTRAGGALKLAYVPATATTATLTDETTGNVLERVTRSRQTIAGINFDTLYDTPTGVTGPQQWGGVFGDLVSGGTLPVTKNLWDKTGATRNQVIGKLMVAAQTSGAAGTCRESRFVFDGTTVTITDLVNTLPVQVVATIALSGNNLQFQASYAGGLGSGCTLTVLVEWCAAGR